MGLIRVQREGSGGTASEGLFRLQTSHRPDSLALFEPGDEDDIEKWQYLFSPKIEILPHGANWNLRIGGFVLSEERLFRHEVWWVRFLPWEEEGEE